jgi:hypothetical protein
VAAEWIIACRIAPVGIQEIFHGPTIAFEIVAVWFGWHCCINVHQNYRANFPLVYRCFRDRRETRRQVIRQIDDR